MGSRTSSSFQSRFFENTAARTSSCSVIACWPRGHSCTCLCTSDPDVWQSTFRTLLIFSIQFLSTFRCFLSFCCLMLTLADYSVASQSRKANLVFETGLPPDSSYFHWLSLALQFNSLRPQHLTSSLRSWQWQDFWVWRRSPSCLWARIHHDSANSTKLNSKCSFLRSSSTYSVASFF